MRVTKLNLDKKINAIMTIQSLPKEVVNNLLRAKGKLRKGNNGIFIYAKKGK